MRRLMLLRHAKSDWSQEGQPDHDRDLNARGREAAPKIGAYLAEHALKPDRVVVSSARRTRETWKLVAATIPHPPKAHFEDRIYEAAPRAILDVVRETPSACQTLLVVGHNPGLHSVALALVKDGAPDALNALSTKFPTAALAVIDLPIDDWSALKKQSGRLDSFVTPRGLHDDD